MYKASAIGDITRQGCSEVGNAKTGICVDGAGTMVDDEPGGAEGKVDIIAKKKQTDANSERYYIMHPSPNKTPMTPNKTNKTPILISP